MTRTSWIGDGWNADVVAGESTITIQVMLLELGAPVLAVITLPRQNATAAFQVFADVIYADAALFGAAVSGLHARRRPARSGRDGWPQA